VLRSCDVFGFGLTPNLWRRYGCVALVSDSRNRQRFHGFGHCAQAVRPSSVTSTLPATSQVRWATPSDYVQHGWAWANTGDRVYPSVVSQSTAHRYLPLLTALAPAGAEEVSMQAAMAFVGVGHAMLALNTAAQEERAVHSQGLRPRVALPLHAIGDRPGESGEKCSLSGCGPWRHYPSQRCSHIASTACLILGFRPRWRVNPPPGERRFRVKGIDNFTHLPVVESTSISVATSMPTALDLWALGSRSHSTAENVREPQSHGTPGLAWQSPRRPISSRGIWGS